MARPKWWYGPEYRKFANPPQQDDKPVCCRTETLTEADITELVELRGQALRSTGRVEFSGGILPKLIRAFCKSLYVDPYNYASTLGDLQDAFYYFKI